VGYGTMNRRFWIIIFDKCSFEFLVSIFRAFFLNEVGPSRYKIDGLNELKRAHWRRCDVTILNVMIKQYKPFQFYIVFCFAIKNIFKLF
jgi:hypothetical protein